MTSSDTNASLCDGFQNGKFEMRSNTSTLFLKIKHVDVSDSGLYFCGVNTNTYPAIFSATYLKVQGKWTVKIRTDLEPVEVKYSKKV